MTGPEGSGRWDPDVDAYVGRPASGGWPDDEWTTGAADPGEVAGSGAVQRWDSGPVQRGAAWTPAPAGVGAVGLLVLAAAAGAVAATAAGLLVLLLGGFLVALVLGVLVLLGAGALVTAWLRGGRR